MNDVEFNSLNKILQMFNTKRTDLTDSEVSYIIGILETTLAPYREPLPNETLPHKGSGKLFERFKV